MNALSYTVSGGIHLCWCHERQSPDRWSYAIHDTGPGIFSGPASPVLSALKEETIVAKEKTDPSAKDLATKSNLSSKQSSGEGIGLSIVKRLCELLDAMLEFETKHGEGATFTVILPSSC